MFPTFSIRLSAGQPTGTTCVSDIGDYSPFSEGPDAQLHNSRQAERFVIRENGPKDGTSVTADPSPHIGRAL